MKECSKLLKKNSGFVRQYKQSVLIALETIANHYI